MAQLGDDPEKRADLEAIQNKVQKFIGELTILMKSFQYLSLHLKEVQDALRLTDAQREGLSKLNQRWFEFLSEQADLWITSFYRFLAGFPSLWPAAAAKPVIRLEDGRQVVPLDGQGRPAVYLPGPAPSSLPTVKRSVADSPAARPYLAALQLTVPDVVAEVLQIVLPRYDGLDIAALDAVQHEADVERVARALDEAAAGRRQELLEAVRATPFLIGENAATG